MLKDSLFFFALLYAIKKTLNGNSVFFFNRLFVLFVCLFTARDIEVASSLFCLCLLADEHTYRELSN